MYSCIFTKCSVIHTCLASMKYWIQCNCLRESPYCDIRPERRNSGRNQSGSPLLGNGSIKTFPWQRKKQNNRGTVRHGDLYSVRLKVSSVRRVQSFGIRQGVQWFSHSSFVKQSPFMMKWLIRNQNQVSHGGREDTRSPVRIGARLRQSLIVICYTIDYNCNRSAYKYNHPNIQSRTRYY
jgi:hypothetical protein